MIFDSQALRLRIGPNAENPVFTIDVYIEKENLKSLYGINLEYCK